MLLIILSEFSHYSLHFQHFTVKNGWRSAVLLCIKIITGSEIFFGRPRNFRSSGTAVFNAGLKCAGRRNLLSGWRRKLSLVKIGSTLGMTFECFVSCFTYFFPLQFTYWPILLFCVSIAYFTRIFRYSLINTHFNIVFLVFSAARIKEYFASRNILRYPCVRQTVAFFVVGELLFCCHHEFLLLTKPLSG